MQKKFCHLADCIQLWVIVNTLQIIILISIGMESSNTKTVYKRFTFICYWKIIDALSGFLSNFIFYFFAEPSLQMKWKISLEMT